MAVTGAGVTSRDVNLAQIERLIASDLLHGSESLCKLLRYLAVHALDHPGGSVKEYRIATEVFGRSTDFDPRLDSTVRVQTGRLRSKLSEYYAGPGAEDKIIVEIPRGSYGVVFQPRLQEAPPAPISQPVPPVAPLQPAVSAPTRPQRGLSRMALAVVALSMTTVISLTALSVLLWSRAHRTTDPEGAGVSTGLQYFWSGFTDGNDLPWLVYSNAEFVGRPESGMRYYDANRDERNHILDHYTGVGEVLAVHELDRLFADMHHRMRVKRGRLLSLDDAKNNDLIFVGSPTENLSLREIPNAQDFAFRLGADPSRKMDLAIVNVHPKAGEKAFYTGSPGVPISEDHALIALVPGLNPSRWVMILAGTTTIGTQAAAEFVSRARNVDELLDKIRLNRGGTMPKGMPPFEAVIHVKVTGGVPVQSQLVALHIR